MNKNYAQIYLAYFNPIKGTILKKLEYKYGLAEYDFDIMDAYWRVRYWTKK